MLWRLAATRTRRGNRRRSRAAAVAEHEAERLLRRAGYEIVDRQVTAYLPITVDDEALEARCRADLLVARRGRHYIAEVKSGDRVTDATHPSTRRQLLEYRLAFDVDGVLLVDMHAREIREVVFPTL